MTAAVLVVGALAQALVWRLVARGTLAFWPAVTVTFAALGLVSLVVGDPSCCRETTWAMASAVGAASGLLLFGATRVVVDLASRHPSIRRTVVDVYRRSQEVPFAAALALTLVIAVPGEELFWRGLVLPELQDATSSATGALLTWAVAVGVNSAWGSVPLLAGVLVGGAVWTGLATWTGGVVAPLTSHLLWTGLMIAWPPGAARAKVTT